MDNQDVCNDQMTLREFKMWSDHSLKNYLSLRKKNVEGDFETLVYRLVTFFTFTSPIFERTKQQMCKLILWTFTNFI